jgi:hypothetical protein
MAVPLRPEAAAFAEQYRFEVDVLAAYLRPGESGRAGPAPLRTLGAASVGGMPVQSLSAVKRSNSSSYLRLDPWWEVTS